MADEFEIFRNEFRPVHVAKLENKIACPHPVCEETVFLQRKRHKIWHALRPPSVPFPWSLAVHHQSLRFALASAMR